MDMRNEYMRRQREADRETFWRALGIILPCATFALVAMHLIRHWME